MKYGYVIKTFTLFCFAFLLVYGGFLTSSYFKTRSTKAREEVKENFYYKKLTFNRNSKGTIDHITRVEISVKDDNYTPKGRVVDVCLNEEKLPLQPADSRTRRGSTVLQLRPSTYTIKWIVQNSINPPTYTEYKKDFLITNSDLWVHVHIKGNKITLN